MKVKTHVAMARMVGVTTAAMWYKAAISPDLDTLALNLSGGLTNPTMTPEAGLVKAAVLGGAALIVTAAGMGGALPDALDVKTDVARAMFGAGGIARKQIASDVRKATRSRNHIRTAIVLALAIPRYLWSYIGDLFFNVTNALLPHRGPSHWGIAALLAGIIAEIFVVSSAMLLDIENHLVEIFAALSLSPHIAALLARSLFVAWTVFVPLAFVLGDFVHLLGDMMTFSGVSFFAPLDRRKVWVLPKSLRFKYDNEVQTLYAAGFGLLCFGLAALILVL